MGNESGKKLLEMCMEQELVVGEWYFQKVGEESVHVVEGRK